MFLLLHSISILVSILYVILLLDYMLLFFRDDPFAKKTVSNLLKVSILSHIILIILRSVLCRHIPFASVFEVFSALALTVIIIYFYIETVSGVKTTGIFILPFVLLLQLFSTLFDSFNVEINHLLTSKFFIFHVISAIVGYSAITISAIYGFLYLMLYHDIKSNRFGIIYNRLPSLEILHNMNYKSIKISFIFITGAIILGSAWSSMSIGSYWEWDIKILSVLIIWLIFGMGFIIKKRFGFSARKLAYLSLIGFLVMLFSLIVVNIYFTTFHEFL